MNKDINVPIKQHEKCIAILELIKDKSRRVSVEKADYNTFIETPLSYRWHKFPFFNEQESLGQIAFGEEVIERLKKYYCNQLNKL